MTKIMEITSFDGYTLKGRLTLPENEAIEKLVVFVNSSGPHTYDTLRNFGAGVVRHNDFYADRLQSHGIAFFAYNTRGVDLGDIPPQYYSLDEEKYLSYLPSNQVEDISYMIKAIKMNEPRLTNSKVLLWGHSEGAIIAPLFAKKYPNMINALILLGVPIDNMRDVLFWQNSGGASMVWYCNNFDRDSDGRIDKEEYEADPNNVVKSILQNATFEQIDINRDGYIDEQDFSIMMADNREAIDKAIENRDNLWLKTYYPVRLTSEWFLEHYSLQSNMELIPTLDLPVFIFHGTLDQNCHVKKVYALKAKVEKLGKNNITINIYDGHDHELNISQYITRAIMSDGMQTAFNSVYSF